MYFGTASIAAGNYDIMAAVMIGGMVPPCAIALATLLFKNKFTKQERESGPVTLLWVLPLSQKALSPLRLLILFMCCLPVLSGQQFPEPCLWPLDVPSWLLTADLRIPGSGTSADVSGIPGGWNCDRRSASWNFKEKSGRVTDRILLKHRNRKMVALKKKVVCRIKGSRINNRIF